MTIKEREALAEALQLLLEIYEKQALTLDCFICGKPMTSEWFKADDKIECPDCWVIL